MSRLFWNTPCTFILSSSKAATTTCFCVIILRLSVIRIRKSSIHRNKGFGYCHIGKNPSKCDVTACMTCVRLDTYGEIIRDVICSIRRTASLPPAIDNDLVRNSSARSTSSAWHLDASAATTLWMVLPPIGICGHWVTVACSRYVETELLLRWCEESIDKTKVFSCLFL